MHVQARARRTDLPGVEEDRAGGAADHGVDVGIGQHDDGRLAAELERHALQSIGGGLVDCLSDERRARERNLVDAGMRHERGADVLAVAGENVHDARRKAGLDDEVAQPQRRQRRLFRRFQDARASGRQRGTELPRGHHERKIPRNDLRHDADGLAPRVGVDARVLEPADRNVDRRAFDLRGPAGHVTEVVARAGHVDDAGHLLRLAVVDALELRELVGVCVDEIGEPPDQRFATRRQHASTKGRARTPRVPRRRLCRRRRGSHRRPTRLPDPSRDR